MGEKFVTFVFALLKTNLISTLVHRALVICSKSTLQNELSNIRSILINSGYPKVVINTAITLSIL